MYDINAHRWSKLYDPKMDPTSDLPCTFEDSTAWTLPGTLQEHILPPCVLLPDETTSLIVCSKWDSSFRLIDTTKVLQIVAQHKERVRCDLTSPSVFCR